jgi:hypothetical protein
MVAKFNHVCAELSNRPVTSQIERAQKIAYSAQPSAAEYPADVIAIIHQIQKSGGQVSMDDRGRTERSRRQGSPRGKWYATAVRKFLERKTAHRSTE